MEVAQLWEKLFALGLNSILSSSNSHVQEFKENLIDRHLDLLEPHLKDLEPNFQMQIMMVIFSKNPELFKNPFWSSYIEQALKIFDEANHLYVHNNGAWYVLLNRIRDLKEPVDWYAVLLKLSAATVEVGSKAPGFSTVLSWLIAADKLNLVNLLHRTEAKSYPKSLKIELYQQVVEFGLLDVKLARRLRSDTSGSLSSQVLTFLFENRLRYDVETFKELIMQFSDTRHKLVARFIALNMPMELVPFLMGLGDSMAMKILDKRLQALED